MRRMNSMLLGHQGASARTRCMYFSMASCVAGSSHDSGRCTMRDRHLDVVEVAELVLDRLQRGEQIARAAARAVS